MAIYLNRNGAFEQAEPVARECPHCGAHAQLLPSAIPSFADLARSHPKSVGLVFRCANCSEPRFVRATVRSVGPERIELSSHLAEVERAKERFQFGYLPARVDEARPLAVRIAGKHCEQGDVVVADGHLPEGVAPGDLLVTPVTGAYGHSMASNYNKVPRPAVVFLRDGEARLVVRRETDDDLLRLDVD